MIKKSLVVLGHMSACKVRLDPKPSFLNYSGECSGEVCSCVRKYSAVKYVLEALGSKIICLWVFLMALQEIVSTSSKVTDTSTGFYF